MIRRILTLTLALVFIILSGRGVFAISPADIQSVDNDTEYYDSAQATACADSQATSLEPGAGSPDGAAFPDLNPTSMADAINSYILKNYPNSEFKGLGATIVADGNHSNISPFIIIAIAQNESAMADPTVVNIINAGNAFGRTAAPGQPTWVGAKPWYKWTPYTSSTGVSETGVEASVDYTAPQNQGAVGGGDEAAYIRAEYGQQIDTNDALNFLEGYDAPVGNGANVAAYIAEVEATMSALIDLTTGTSSVSSDQASGGCASGGSIVQTALALAWPTEFTTPTANRATAITPTTAYAAALQQFNPSEYTATGGDGDDCGVFVATVMRDSGADPNYPVVSTVTQAEYVIAHPTLYKIIYPATSTAQLEPGDILIINDGTTDINGVINVGAAGGGAGGHTYIYVGPQAGGYNEASASLGDRSANLGVSEFSDPNALGDSFLIARLIQ